MRDWSRFLAPGSSRYLVPGAAVVSALLIATVVGPSSAALPSAAHSLAGAHLRSARSAAAHPHATHGVAGTATSNGPAPGLDVTQSGKFTVPVALTASRTDSVAPLHAQHTADLMVVASGTLPRDLADRISRLSGVSADEGVDAARIRVNGKFVAMLGVDPSTFRAYAAKPTARSNRLWQGVAEGALSVSYSMGKLDKLPLGGTVTVSGAKQEKLRVGSFATVGIAGVDAVVSGSVAQSLGFPQANAILVSAPHTSLSKLTTRIQRMLPHGAAVDALVSQSDASGTSGVAGITGVSPRSFRGYPTLTAAELTTMLNAALSRRGMPYVWGGDGPKVFDCSGLVQWSFRQAGLVMPRVAADQALTGPAVPLSQIEAGDLLFYHTDPTDPNYISHVALYLGHGLMIQAPEPGMDVEVVPIALGSEFAGAVRVDPAIAARVAASV